MPLNKKSVIAKPFHLKSIRVKAVAIFRCVFRRAHLPERHNGRLLRRMPLPFLRLGILPRNELCLYLIQKAKFGND
jgi:hypothetical protein